MSKETDELQKYLSLSEEDKKEYRIKLFSGKNLLAKYIEYEEKLRIYQEKINRFLDGDTSINLVPEDAQALFDLMYESDKWGYSLEMDSQLYDVALDFYIFACEFMAIDYKMYDHTPEGFKDYKICVDAILRVCEKMSISPYSSKAAKAIENFLLSLIEEAEYFAKENLVISITNMLEFRIALKKCSELGGAGDNIEHTFYNDVIQFLNDYIKDTGNGNELGINCLVIILKLILLEFDAHLEPKSEIKNLFKDITEHVKYVSEFKQNLNFVLEPLNEMLIKKEKMLLENGVSKENYNFLVSLIKTNFIYE